jgi:hypothetical protein
MLLALGAAILAPMENLERHREKTPDGDVAST